MLARIAKRSKAAIIAFKIYNNSRLKRAAARGVVETLHGATHRHKSLADSLSYINTQFEDYLRYGGLSPEQLKGLRVFELGFGDNVGVALKFLAAGAERTVCLDKFYSTRDVEHQRRIYLALRETLTYEQQRRFDVAIDLTSGIELNPDKLKCIYGSDVMRTTELPESELFDLAISRAAIEEVYDPGPAFDAIDRLLAPDGLMLHKIDLSDYGMFSSNDMNPLTFLTIAEPVYRLMAADSGLPNRKPKSYYKRVLSEMGYDVKALITGVIGSGGKGDLHPHREAITKGVEYNDTHLNYVSQVRSSLAAEFRNLPDEDLLVDGIFVVARKCRYSQMNRKANEFS
jgi:hypothetical protein